MPWLALGLGLLSLVSVPWWAAQQPFVLHMLVTACVLVVPAVGLNLMLGHGGLVSLGHMGFAGIGAYVAAVLMVDARWSFGAAVVAAFGCRMW
jgi:branched-chain amino acid transport system permease protein